MTPMQERPIRRAASLVCARPSAGGPEVLVVERSAGSRFLPGYVAFPGGAVDGDDEVLATRWFGTADEGPRAAALRELIEEVGLAVTAGGAVPGGLEAIDDAPPAVDTLHELCHWIAPPEVPVRFDARYFTVGVGPGAEPEPDGHEVAGAWWTSARRLLEGWESGARKLYWPTWLTVTELAGCATLEELIGLHFTTRDPTELEEATMPRHVMEQE
jgi:8-oxo-dGTP pyrophosphatase MutT (NUDIX family)